MKEILKVVHVCVHMTKTIHSINHIFFLSTTKIPGSNLFSGPLEFTTNANDVITALQTQSNGTEWQVYADH